jgi:Arc/MetJ-type ribon-helix-helix transcriptional regulator
MVDSIVSVRMPSSLVQKLKRLSSENHFLDVSEEVRSIIKTKIKFYGDNSYTKTEEQIEKKESPDYKTENIIREELVKKLKLMIKELENKKNE